MNRQLFWISAILFLLIFSISLYAQRTMRTKAGGTYLRLPSKVTQHELHFRQGGWAGIRTVGITEEKQHNLAGNMPQLDPFFKLVGDSKLAATVEIQYAAFHAQLGTTVNYDDPQFIARGKKLFNVNCSPCHGAQAVGENPARVNGGSKPGGSYWAPALNGTAHAWHHPPDDLFRRIKNGSFLRGSPMPSWNRRLSDQEIHSVIAYFQSLWPANLRKGYRERFARKLPRGR